MCAQLLNLQLSAGRWNVDTAVMKGYGQFCAIAQASEVLTERWLRRPIFEETPDTGLLMWWVRTTVKTDELSPGRTVIHFRFLGAPEKLRSFWLVFPEADLCLSDPGFGVDLTVLTDPKTLTA